jgi:4-hydroxyacetophenone monooxygenase
MTMRMDALARLDLDELAMAIRDADLATLCAVVSHATGSTEWFREDWVGACQRSLDPAAVPLTDAERAPLIDEAHEQLLRLARDEAPADRPPRRVLLDAADVALGGHGRDEDGDTLLRMLRLDATPESLAPAALPEELHIVVVGAGVAGIRMAMDLQRRGAKYTLVDKNTGPGGVWLANRYPGCGLDSTAEVYSYLEWPNPAWSKPQVRRDEVLEYLQRCMEVSWCLDHCRFGTEVRSAVFDDRCGRWQLLVRSGDGEHIIEADIVVFALGSLSQPKEPLIAGIERFAGTVAHTADWPDDLELSGRRVGVIGTGSSGVQAGPAIAEVASSLVHFQRSKHWIAPNPELAVHYRPGVRWLAERVPYYAEWRRFLLYAHGDLNYERIVVDPDWDGPGISEVNERSRARFEAYVRSELATRPELVDAVLPDYPPFGKRVVRDSGWYRMLTRDNVRLVTSPIERAVERGLVTRDGQLHELDVLVFATGFHNTKYLWPVEVRGITGETPAQLAGGADEVRALLGVCIPKFPTCFFSTAEFVRGAWRQYDIGRRAAM